MTHEAQFSNGVLEYTVHVIQSKFSVQSNFNITQTLYLFVSDTMERMDSQNCILDLFSSSPPIHNPSILKLSSAKTLA